MGVGQRPGRFNGVLVVHESQAKIPWVKQNRSPRDNQWWGGSDIATPAEFQVEHPKSQNAWNPKDSKPPAISQACALLTARMFFEADRNLSNKTIGYDVDDIATFPWRLSTSWWFLRCCMISHEMYHAGFADAFVPRVSSCSCPLRWTRLVDAVVSCSQPSMLYCTAVSGVLLLYLHGDGIMSIQSLQSDPFAFNKRVCGMS